MPTEIANYISELDPNRPNENEPLGEADDHLNLIKSVLQNTVNFDESITLTAAEINALVDDLAAEAAARIAADDALDTAKAPRTHFNDNDDSAEILHAGAVVLSTLADALLMGTGVDTLRAAGEIRLEREGGSGVLSSTSSGDALLFGAGNARLRALAIQDANSFAAVDNNDGEALPVGFNIMPALALNSNRNVAVGDIGYMLRSSSTRTLDVVSLKNGATIGLCAVGATTTIAQGSGQTLTWLNGTQVNGQRTITNGVATLWQRSTSSWYIWGTGIS